MESAVCLIEFLDSRDRICYGVKYIGVVTRDYIYAKCTHNRSSNDYPLYIKLKVSSTRIKSNDWYPHWPKQVHRISVNESIGIHKDMRFDTNPKIWFGIRKGIEKAFREWY